jgi:hypothetical protein
MHRSGHELNSVAGDEKRLTVCEPDDLLARDAMRSSVQVAHSPRLSSAISPTF